MMMDDPKQLSEASAIGPTDRQSAKLDAARAISRRQQALLAAAGEMVPDRRWAILHVDNRRDNDVDNQLSRAMIDHWLPLRKADETRGGKRRGAPGQPVWMLAWPGYVFIKIADTAAAWQGIMTIKHVKSVLGVSERPFFFGDDKFMRFKAELATLKVCTGPETMYVEGEAVTVIDGPFASFPGKVADIAHSSAQEGRARVEVMIFGRAVPVELDLAQIAKRV